MGDPNIQFRGGWEGWVGEMRLNAKGTVGSFGGKKLIYNKIITPRSASGTTSDCEMHLTVSYVIFVIF